MWQHCSTLKKLLSLILCLFFFLIVVCNQSPILHILSLLRQNAKKLWKKRISSTTSRSNKYACTLLTLLFSYGVLVVVGCFSSLVVKNGSFQDMSGEKDLFPLSGANYSFAIRQRQRYAWIDLFFHFFQGGKVQVTSTLTSQFIIKVGMLFSVSHFTLCGNTVVL